MPRTSMGIRARLALVVFVPAAALLFYLISTAISSYTDMSRASQVSRLAAIAVKASHLVHELQKERGMTAGFINSGGGKFQGQILEQRKLTDQRRTDLRAAVAALPDAWHELGFLQAIDRGESAIDGIVDVRTRVSALDIPLGEALGFYTGLNGDYLSSIEALKELLPDSRQTPMVSSFFNYVQMKERMGIERAVGSAAFAADRFTPALFSRFQTLLTLQSTFEGLFLLSAADEVKAFYRQTVSGPEVDEVRRLEGVAQTYDDKVSAGAALAPLIGYGGLIQEFKNFELGRGFEESERFLQDFDAMHDAVEAYKAIPYISEADMADLNVLESTMIIYRDALARVAELLDQGVHAEDIDAQVDVDDGPAVEALGRLVLGGSLGQDPERWFQLITVKINKVKAVEDFISSRLIDSTNAFNDRATLFFWMTLCVGLLLLIAIIAIAYRTANSISDAIQSAAESVALVADGDLSHEIDVDRRDEIGQLLEAINRMIVSLNIALGRVSNTGRSIADGAGEVSSSSGKLSQAATDQAAALQQITSTVTQIESQTQKNAENADRANVLAGNVQEQASKGAASVAAMTQSMADITESSAAIAQVTKVVDDIAFQTNLLALNASVEAARAGAEGRGFAVVAEEVRSLATRSSEAAREIQAMVETAREYVESGSVRVASAQQSLDEIQDAVAQVTQVFAEIASASAEQSLGISQVQTGLSSLDQIAQQNAQVSDANARISGDFVHLAEDLQAELSRFDLDDTDGHAGSGTLQLPPVS